MHRSVSSHCTLIYRGLLFAQMTGGSCSGLLRSTQVNCRTAQLVLTAGEQTIVNGFSVGLWKSGLALGCMECVLFVVHFERLPAITVALAAPLGCHQHLGGCGWGNEKSIAEVPRAVRKCRNSYSSTCP